MTVAELIEALRQYPPDMPVYVGTTVDLSSVQLTTEEHKGVPVLVIPGY